MFKSLRRYLYSLTRVTTTTVRRSQVLEHNADGHLCEVEIKRVITLSRPRPRMQWLSRALYAYTL